MGTHKSCPTEQLQLGYCCVGDVDLLNIIETVNEGNKQEGEGVAAMALFNFFSPVPPSQQSGNVLRR